MPQYVRGGGNQPRKTPNSVPLRGPPGVHEHARCIYTGTYNISHRESSSHTNMYVFDHLLKHPWLCTGAHRDGVSMLWVI